MDQTGFAMHQTWGSIHGATVDIGQRLVPQTDPKGRNFPAEVRQHLSTASTLRRSARSGRNQQVGGSPSFGLRKKDGVVAFNSNFCFRTNLMHKMHQVPSEGVVVVNDQDLHGTRL